MSETAENYFRRNGIKYRRQAPDKNGHVNLEFECPACQRPKKAQINDVTWLWQCHSGKCNAKGNEYSLKKIHGNLYDITKKGESIEDIKARQFRDAMVHRASAKNEVEKWEIDLHNSKHSRHAREYLRKRGISAETQRRACLGWSATFPGGKPQGRVLGRHTGQIGDGWLMIPAFTKQKGERPDTSSAAMVKCRNLDPNAGKGQRYRRIAGGQSVLYAPCGIDPNQTLILVSGELDALSLVEAGWTNVASSTTGEGNWDDVWTLQLENVADIVIIYDNDEAGKEGALKVAHILGLHRCRIGTWPEDYNDANDCLVALGTDALNAFDVFFIGAVVAQSKEVAIDGIFSISDLKDRYLALFDGSEPMRGISTGWDDLDNLIGGWRPGEVTMVTGDTGSGKTTFTSQAALKLSGAKHGVIYCPFEMGTIDQLNKWVRQHGKNAPDELEAEKRVGVVESLEGMPLWMFYADANLKVEALRNTLVYAAKRLHVRFAVIDHIHWLVSSGPDERKRLDDLCHSFVQVARETNVHMIIVAHPRSLAHSTRDKSKDRDNTIVQMNDIKGTSRLKQDAHNILSVWRPRKAERQDAIDETGFGKSIVYVLKCRSEYGSEGAVSFRYWIRAALMLDHRMQLKLRHGEKQTYHDTAYN